MYRYCREFTMAQVQAPMGEPEIRTSQEESADENPDDPIQIGEEEAWWILQQETTPHHFANGSRELKHQVVGGALLEKLSRSAKASGSRERILNREWLALKWNKNATRVQHILDGVVKDAFPHGKELGHDLTGVLVVLDTDIVENTELGELADALMELKVQMDSYNAEEDTDYYAMVALVHYTKEETDRYMDARVASANAVISTFNSFMRRPTLDWNRYLLDTEVGRPINIRNETRWRVDPEHFDESGLKEETLTRWADKLMEFLNDDDGLRCKEDDLTFPFKKDKDGVPRFLSGYFVRDDIPSNRFGIKVEGIDAEALYWVRFRLLASGGASLDEVPPLPELDLNEYSFRPWRKGQSADSFPETQEERDRWRQSRRTRKEEKERRRSLERQNRWINRVHEYLVADVAKVVKEKKDKLAATVDK